MHDKLDMLKEYLQWRGTGKDLTLRIRRYYEFYYKRQAVYDEHGILGGLSPNLKRELVLSNCKQTLGRIPLFSR